MKATIERTFRQGEKVVDAETEFFVLDLFQMERPIRVLLALEELAPVTEADLLPLRKVLRKKFSAAQVEELTQLLRTPNDSVTKTILLQGDDHVIYYYQNALSNERYDALQQRDTNRRESPRMVGVSWKARSSRWLGNRFAG
jgi:hypothetical protein